MTKSGKKDFVNGLAVILGNLFLVLVTRDACADLVHGERGQAQPQRVCNALTTFFATQSNEILCNFASIHYFHHLLSVTERDLSAYSIAPPAKMSTRFVTISA